MHSVRVVRILKFATNAQNIRGLMVSLSVKNSIINKIGVERKSKNRERARKMQMLIGREKNRYGCMCARCNIWLLFIRIDHREFVSLCSILTYRKFLFYMLFILHFI